MKPSGVITSMKDPIVVDARRRLAAGPGEADACFLADGARMVRQALAAGAAVEMAFFLEGLAQDQDREVFELARSAGVPCCQADKAIFFKVLDLGYQTSVGCLAVIRRPASAPLPQAAPVSQAAAQGTPRPRTAGQPPCVLVGQSIQDPRNVGVLIRTADAWSAHVLFSADSADPWSRAAVRSTTGSIFRVPITLAAELDGCLRQLRLRGFRMVGSSAHAAKALWQVDLRGPVALVLGNETAGMSDDIESLCDEVALIPMSGWAHSFNVTVAAGILLYERQRQLASRPGIRE